MDNITPHFFKLLAIIVIQVQFASAEFLVPIDGNETYTCIWTNDSSTKLADPKGSIKSFSKIITLLSQQIISQKVLLDGANGAKKDKIKSKILQLRATKRGVQICKIGKFDISDGVPDLPVNPTRLIVGSGRLSTKLNGSVFCLIASYVIRNGKSNGGSSGYMLCKPDYVTPAQTGYNFYLIRPNQSPADIVINQSRYTQTERILLDGSLCTTASYIPCVSENAQKFRDKISADVLQLTLSIGGVSEDYYGEISCSSGC